MKRNFKKLIIFIMGIGILFTITGCSKDKEETKNNSSTKEETKEQKDFSFTETLSMDEAFNTLNWFHNQDDKHVWQVSIKVLENKLSKYNMSSIIKSSKEKEYFVTFRTKNLPENKNYIKLMIQDNTYENYKKTYDMYKKIYNDYEETESTYNDYNIFNNNYKDSIDMIKEISDSEILIISLQKNSAKDKVDYYETYIKTLIDTVTYKKHDYSSFKNTHYLSNYKQGWNSSGGGHLYLNSSTIKIDDKLTLDLSDYSVADINDGADNKLNENSFKYGMIMMHHKYEDDKYFNFNIYYIENTGDTYYKQEFASGNYDMSIVKVNDVEFEHYKHKTKGDSYYKYNTTNGYYLFNKYEDFQKEFETIVK